MFDLTLLARCDFKNSSNLFYDVCNRNIILPKNSGHYLDSDGHLRLNGSNAVHVNLNSSTAIISQMPGNCILDFSCKINSKSSSSELLCILDGLNWYKMLRNESNFLSTNFNFDLYSWHRYTFMTSSSLNKCIFYVDGEINCYNNSYTLRNLCAIIGCNEGNTGYVDCLLGPISVYQGVITSEFDKNTKFYYEYQNLEENNDSVYGYKN